MIVFQCSHVWQAKLSLFKQLYTFRNFLSKSRFYTFTRDKITNSLWYEESDSPLQVYLHPKILYYS